MYSRQQYPFQLDDHLEQMRLHREKQTDERQLANMDSPWVRTSPQGLSKINLQRFHSPFPDTLTTYPTPRRPPDPPDFKPQIEYLKFDGTKLGEWIRCCDKYFDLHRTPPEMKVRVVSPFMIGKARQWHNNFMREHYGMFPYWTDYVIAISAKFGGLDDPISELINLRQAGDSVEVYLGKFQLVLAKLVLPMHHALDIFLKNMVPYLAVYVKQHNVTTVAEAARIAKLHEELQYIPITQPRAPFNPYYKNPYETSRLPPTTAIETPNSYEKRQEKRNIEELLHMSYEDVSMSNDEAVHKTDSSQLEKEKPAVLVLGDLQAKDKQDKREHEHTCLATPRLEKGILVVELSESELQHVERNSNNHGEEKLQNNEAHISSNSMSKGLVYEKEEDKLENKEAIAEKEFVGTKETKVKDVIVKETIQTEESSREKSPNLGATLDFTLKVCGAGLQIKTESLSPSKEEKELRLGEVTKVFPYQEVLISDSHQIKNRKLQSHTSIDLVEMRMGHDIDILRGLPMSLRETTNEKQVTDFSIKDGLLMTAHGFFDFPHFNRVWELGGVIEPEKSKGFYKCDKLVRPIQELSTMGRTFGCLMEVYDSKYGDVTRDKDNISGNVYQRKVIFTLVLLFSNEIAMKLKSIGIRGTSVGFRHGSLPRPPEDNHSDFKLQVGGKTQDDLFWCAKSIGSLTDKEQQEDTATGAKMIKVNMKPFENHFILVHCYEIFHSPRPPEHFQSSHEGFLIRFNELKRITWSGNITSVEATKWVRSSFTLMMDTQDAAEGVNMVKLTIKQFKFHLVTYEIFHSPRPPELSLRTKMF